MTRKCPHREVGPEKSKNRQGGPYSLLLARQSSQPRPGPGISGPGCPRVVQGVQGWSRVSKGGPRWSSDGPQGAKVVPEGSRMRSGGSRLRVRGGTRLRVREIEGSEGPD